VFGLGSFVAGLQLFVAIVVVFTLGLALVAAPFLYWIPGVEYGPIQTPSTVKLGAMSVDATPAPGVGVNTLPQALIAALLGVIVCLASLHAVNLTARLFGALTERVLGTHSA
jgi:hypothetical protein